MDQLDQTCLQEMKHNPSCCHCSVIKLCPPLCDPMDCRAPGFLVLHHLPEFAQTHAHWVSDAIQPAHPFSHPPFSSYPQSFPASGSFPMSQLIASGSQRIGASASASVLPMNIQGWFPLAWTVLISLPSKGLSRVFSSTTAWRLNSLALSLLRGPEKVLLLNPNS